MSAESRKVCVSCDRLAPEATTEYTLISAKHGWRLDRRIAADGSFTLEWYCAECWRRRREATAVEPSPDSLPKDSQPKTVRIGERSGRQRIGARKRSRGDVLIVGDDRYTRSTLARALIREGYAVRAIESADVPTHADTSARAVVMDRCQPFSATFVRVMERFPGVMLVIRAIAPEEAVDLGKHQGRLTMLHADASPSDVIDALDRGFAIEDAHDEREATTRASSATAETERPPRRAGST